VAVLRLPTSPDLHAQTSSASLSTSAQGSSVPFLLAAVERCIVYDGPPRDWLNIIADVHRPRLEGRL